MGSWLVGWTNGEELADGARHWTLASRLFLCEFWVFCGDAKPVERPGSRVEQELAAKRRENRLPCSRGLMAEG